MNSCVVLPDQCIRCLYLRLFDVSHFPGAQSSKVWASSQWVLLVLIVNVKSFTVLVAFIGSCLELFHYRELLPNKIKKLVVELRLSIFKTESKASCSALNWIELVNSC